VLPNPLHPAIVHFPIVLMFLLPISAAAALWAIRRGASVTRMWAIPVIVAAALTGASWLSVETGEQQEERVEAVVPEQAVESHADAAETFLVASALVLVVTAAGLVSATPGRAARVVATVGAVALVAAGVRVGHSGGQLVYQHGAAAAYASGSGGAPTPSSQREHRETRDGEQR
jgi:uncharacterized membrane protein